MLIGKPKQQLVPLVLLMCIGIQVTPYSGLGKFWINQSRAATLVNASSPKESVMLPLVTPYPQRSDGKQMAPAFALQQLDDTDTIKAKKAVATVGDPEAVDTPALQGTVTSIRVTRGRSQIVKFAQPVMRLSIADPVVADIIPLGPDQIMINGKQRGVTSLIVWDENGQEGIFDLYIQNDTSELLDAVHAISPHEKIQARVTDDSFILSGQVSNSVILDEIRKTAAAYGYRDDKFVDLTDTPVPQVVLEVRVAEASRSIGRDLGTSFSQHSQAMTLNRNLAAPDSTVISSLSRTTLGLIPGSKGLAPGNSTKALMAQSVNNVGGLTGTLFRNEAFDFAWNLLETHGKVNTLANPSLVCTHGRTASFLAGGEFPYVASVSQTNVPSIQFKEFGVKLNFTPWVSPVSGRIELSVTPEVSNIDSSTCQNNNGFQVCGIAKRSANTTVDLQDGETLMISGILSREEQNSFTSVPFVNSLPVIGNFFKNAHNQKLDRELVVVITPHIIKPSDYGKVLGSMQ